MGDVTPETLAKHFARCISQRVAELPDRTSPEDWPEAMLVTADELEHIVETELVENIREGGTRPREAELEAALREARTFIEHEALNRNAAIDASDYAKEPGRLLKIIDAALNPKTHGGEACAKAD